MLNAVICTVIPMMLIMICVRKVGSAITSQAGILGPLSTIFMGWYFLGEEITYYQMSGLVLVVAAMWLLMNSQNEKLATK
jgi:drug/metabolite transporter (DMT)-like permease